MEHFLLAEMEGFEPSCLSLDKTISSRSRYDHFDTSPYSVRCFYNEDYYTISFVKLEVDDTIINRIFINKMSGLQSEMLLYDLCSLFGR